jgi:hypothetical protein
VPTCVEQSSDTWFQPIVSLDIVVIWALIPHGRESPGARTRWSRTPDHRAGDSPARIGRHRRHPDTPPFTAGSLYGALFGEDGLIKSGSPVVLGPIARERG